MNGLLLASWFGFLAHSVAPVPPLRDSYHFSQLEMDRAWQLTQGKSEVRVAILSTGVNYRLAELSDAIAINPGESGDGRETNGIDDDGNGIVDDVFGANTAEGTGDPTDTQDAGTFSASLLVSRSYGLAPSVSLIPVAVCDRGGSCTLDAVVRGMDYAVARGASLILMPVGGILSAATQAGCEAIRRAAVPVVSVAGNTATDLSRQDRELFFPADCGAPNLTIVAPTQRNRSIAPFSNYGARVVHVAAPGVNIPGLDSQGRAIQSTGSTTAAAIGAAVGALVLSQRPGLSATGMREALVRGTVPTAALQEKVQSGGLLSAYRALVANER